MRPYSAAENHGAVAGWAENLPDPGRTKLLAIGGDHSIAAANIRATWERLGRPAGGLPVLHFDAHLDRGNQVARHDDDSVEKTAILHELGNLLEKAVEQLPARERRLIRAHYYHDRTLQKAGSELGISKSWASRLHARAIDQLRNSIATVGAAA